MAQLTIQQAFDLALQHHESGRLLEAEQLYRQILQHQPGHVDAMHLLGVVAHQCGRNDVAVDLIHRAIALNPNLPEAYSNLGAALMGQGKIDEAIAAYHQAIGLRPSYAEAYNNLGHALQGKGQVDQAIAVYHQAIALRTDFPEAYNNLCTAFTHKRQFEQAISAAQRAIAQRPNYSQAHSNLGNALQSLGRIDEAVVSYRQAIALTPNDAETHSNLGNAFGIAGRSGEAITELQKAIALRPNFPEAHLNLGNVLCGERQFDQAIAAYRQAIAMRPEFADARSNLGDALTELKQLDEAIVSYRQAIALDPGSPQAHVGLAGALKMIGELDPAIAAYRRAMALSPDEPTYHSSLIFTLHYHPEFDDYGLAEEHRRWNRQHGEPLQKALGEPPGMFFDSYANDPNPNRKLRIGYVSPSLMSNPIGRFLLPLLENHNPESVEVFAYAQVRHPDAMTHRLRARTDTWRSLIGLSDAQAADQVRQDRIDILVDLTLHAPGNRLMVFAHKPAPLQVNYLAYASTSGLPTMDYRISDPFLDPPGTDESVYSEMTIRLPETYWCYEPVVNDPPRPPPVVEKGFITFGCLNEFAKINQPLLMMWARVLNGVTRSRLLLHAHEGSHRQRLLDHLYQQRIEPQRVSFMSRLPTASYFEQYHSIDIALDTSPYGGGTTTCDALWMGVPVVSLRGKTAVGRGGSSILNNLHLPELVANTPEEYVHIATSLANDVPRLNELRSMLRPRMQQSPLMDAPKFTRNIEAAYRQMWHIWCEASTK